MPSEKCIQKILSSVQPSLVEVAPLILSEMHVRSFQKLSQELLGAGTGAQFLSWPLLHFPVTHLVFAGTLYNTPFAIIPSSAMRWFACPCVCVQKYVNMDGDVQLHIAHSICRVHI